MAFSAPQLASLKATHQGARCRFVAFPAWYAEGINVITPGAISWQDLVNVYPRHSWIDVGETITLDGTYSIVHGGAAATGHVWSLEAGSGSIHDNSDGTCDYTAPGSGSGVATIQLQTDGNVAANLAYVAYGSAELNVGAVTGFHADIETGGWEMTIRAYGDCSGFDRGVGVLVVVDDYWNGSVSNFGGFLWGEGVYYGYVVDPRRVHEDHAHTYMEFTIESPEARLKVARLKEIFFSKTDTGEELWDADFVVMDAIWWVLMDKFNQRHNCWIFTDTNSPSNLKLSEGPMWDVLEDVAKRCFGAIYATRLGDVHVIPDADVRWGEIGTVPLNTGAMLEFTTDLFESIDLEQWDDPAPGEDPPGMSDPPVQQVILTGIQADLSEIWARYPSDANITAAGRVEEVSGLICDSPVTLEAWAGKLYHKLCGTTQADLRLFLFHHLDLYETCDLAFVPNTARVTNHGLYDTSPSDMYVSSMDFEIDPGTGKWRGSVHIIARATQNPSDVGENSADE